MMCRFLTIASLYINRTVLTLLALHLFCNLAGPERALAAAPVKLICLGDSLTSGQGLPVSQSFPAVLERELNRDPASPRVQVTNSGVAGETSGGLLERLNWALAEPYQVAVVATGGNDILRGLDPAGTARHLDAILAKLKSRGLVVVLAGMRAPRNLGEKYQRDFDSLFPRLAKKHGVYFAPFFLAPVAGRGELLQSDGLHPNPQGVRAMVAAMLPRVSRAVAQAAKAAP
jgi:acyl-CoA thioesterase I